MPESVVRRVGGRSAAALHLLGIFVALAVTAPAEARVNPISIITRQIHKPNMLVVLDTSGSMTGVPGGSFSNGSEVGVDCDNGRDCRGWTAGADQGACLNSDRPCAVNADCQAAFCRLGAGACTSDADCPSQGTCQVGGHVCSTDADCTSYGDGLCTGSGSVCSALVPCPPHGKCSGTPTTCDSPGKDCKAGFCQRDKNTSCVADSDCGADGPGSCASGKTPKAGCTRDSDCAETRRCDTGESCAVDADCPKILAGSCSQSGRSCQSDADCDGGGQNDNYVDFCQIPTNTCSGQPNTCTLSYYKCQFSAGNTCIVAPNVCQPVKNVCNITAKNYCQQPVPGDTCQLGTAKSGALKMCQLAQFLCKTDADCPTGDTCGAPSSRTVIAKRTLGQVISESYSVVNLGLMTFFQDRYFPYYQLTNPSPSSDRVYLSRPFLEPVCYDKTTGPTTSCSYEGVTQALASGRNSRYSVKRKGQKVYYDVAWCGDFCAIPGVGTGHYEGSYWVGAGNTGTLAKSPQIFSEYMGKSVVVGGKSYRYYDARPDYYNGGASPPISAPDCSKNQCNATCGGRWDASLSGFIDPYQDETEAKSNALTMLAWLNKASYGGLVTFGGTPSGCTLENDGTKSVNSSAYHYMEKLRGSDALACRQNYVLFITDGEANGPGDNNCTANACSAADPEASGCKCKVVLAAWHMRKNLGVRTFVVGFSSDAASGNARIINDNVAKAGGTDQGNDGTAPYAFSATNEVQLVAAIEGAIFDAVRGSYSTAPASGSSGSQLTGSIRAGKYALDARVDFPSWEGHLIAYDTSVTPPVVAWDANAELKKMKWWERRVYVGTKDGNAIRIQVDAATKAVTNRTILYQLGLGSSPDEAEDMARFLLGDPAANNPAVLGAMINSTPIDVGQVGDNPAPGGHQFFLNNKSRPSLTYVGADDGMLHAFFTNNAVVGGTTYSAGSEAFAYVPPAMLSTVAKLFAQGGQAADPRRHIFGLANSAKVKSLCIKNCTDATTAIWKTVLVMNYGYGGAGLFMLDITNPVSGLGFADPPVVPLWHSDDTALAASYKDLMGLAVSVPGFVYNKTTGKDDQRLIMASGYPVTSGSKTQGRSLVVSDVATGRVLTSSLALQANSCTQELTLLADVATAKDFTKGEEGKLRAAYVGDTWGNLFRYDGTTTTRVAAFGCENPLHFSPTVVQLDRDDPNNHPGEVYLVQVTNSALDDDTAAFAPSQMVLMKEVLAPTGKLQTDLTFGTGGRIVLRSDLKSDICAVTDDKGQCKAGLPPNARPTGTPTAILKRDGSGFQLMSMWYAPDQAGCGKGGTWLTLHDVSGSTVTQKQGMFVGSEPVTSPVIANGRIFVVGSQGTLEIGSSLSSTFSNGTSSPVAGLGSGVFETLGWTELQ